MSERTTIDSLSIKTSEQYAGAEAARQSQVYRDIISPSSARPQVAVLAPAQGSQLEALTGALGQKHSLAQYLPPPDTELNNAFTYNVFPAFNTSNQTSIMTRLETAEGSAPKVRAAINMLAELNGMGQDAYARCRQLKQG